MSEATEQWRGVPGHPDYDVSSLGRVRSWKRPSARRLNKPHVMSPFTDTLGYVRLHMDGRQYSVHRVVAAAWHGPCPNGREVDHINRARNDNRPENLQYLTRQQNMARAAFAIATHCKQGHPFTGNNLLVVSTDGERRCRTCNRKWAEDLRARRVDAEIPGAVHGTPNGYINHNCRCVPCKTANSDYRRKKRQAA